MKSITYRVYEGIELEPTIVLTTSPLEAVEYVLHCGGSHGGQIIYFDVFFDNEKGEEQMHSFRVDKDGSIWGV